MNVFGYLMDDAASYVAERLDDAIKLTDGVVDHEFPPETCLDVFATMAMLMEVGVSIPKLSLELGELIQGEYADLSYMPGSADLSDDIAIWSKKAGRLSVEFAIACGGDKTLDTPENWDTVKSWQIQGLIANDCDDLMTLRFEDLKQRRRNFVLLNKFGPDIYDTWPDRVEEIVNAAMKTYDSISFMKPEDQRLMKAWEVANGMLLKSVNSGN